SDDAYFPKLGAFTFLISAESLFSEICGNKVTAYINDLHTAETWDDEFYYNGITNGSERISKFKFRENRETLLPDCFGPFATNLNTWFVRRILSQIKERSMTSSFFGGRLKRTGNHIPHLQSSELFKSWL
ncbi:MAG: hypothetical protein KBS95_05990, partial [Alistipes sp.]|nr:hypothetical protein [Candidatus Alistipes equi]